MVHTANPPEYDKIMAGDRLWHIVERLEGCAALVYALCEVAGISATPEAALFGVADHLRCIVRDLEADIAAAKDYPEGGQLGEAARKENL